MSNASDYSVANLVLRKLKESRKLHQDDRLIHIPKIYKHTLDDSLADFAQVYRFEQCRYRLIDRLEFLEITGRCEQFHTPKLAE